MAADSDFRDPSLAALMREHSCETPPSNVDEAILAVARDAARLDAQARSRAPVVRFLRIAMPTAAAAAVAIVIVNLQPLGPKLQDNVRQEVATTRAVPDGAKRDSGGSPPSAVDTSAPSPQTEARSSIAQSLSKREATPMPQKMAAHPPTGVVAAPSQTEKIDASASASGARVNGVVGPSSRSPMEMDAQQREPRAPAVQDRPTFAPAPSANPSVDAALQGPAAVADLRAPSLRSDATRDGPAMRDGSKDTSSVGEWIARIRALRDAGRTREALDELARFRERFTDADARLPDDLRTLR